MKTLILFLIAIVYNSGELLPQNWVPLENGNLYQYIRTTQTSANLNYELQNRMVGSDTLINEKKYHQYIYNNYTSLLSFSEADQKVFQWFSGDHRLYVDFSKAPGDTFLCFNSGSGGVATVLSGSVNIFSNSTSYKGYQATFMTPMPTTKRELFAEGIGLYFSSSYLTQGGTRFDLIMAIVYDSLGVAHLYTDHFKPQIIVTPITLISTINFVLDFQVSHQHNRRSYSMPGTPLNFISTVKIERFYSKEDSTITLEDIYATENDFPNYIYQAYLDTTLLKNGFVYNYRIVATDRGIIPERTISPDTGYYQCVWDFSTNIDDELPVLKEFALQQNYPNPFNPTTKISWQSPVGSWQTLKVFDVLGREVATLVDEYRNAGSFEVDFNASDLPSNVYMYRIQAGAFIDTKKMILLR